MPTWRLSTRDLSRLLEHLRSDGYEIIGPQVQDGTIVYAPLESIDQLPRGMREQQEAGRYRLNKGDPRRLFGFNQGPHSAKNFLFPSKRKLYSVSRGEQMLRFHPPQEPPPKRVLLGLRACELNAIAVQDRTFLNGPYENSDYRARRDHTLIIAVNCSQAADTCFCTSMHTGPRAESGFDLALTECIQGNDHFFTATSASRTGTRLMRQLGCKRAGKTEQTASQAETAHAINDIKLHFDTSGVQALLQDNPDHPQWDEVASRCLSCGNCTLVCPTCFCSTVEDTTDLAGEQAERWLSWDSCFNADHSYLHGGSVHAGTRSRYRQWLTHKLSTWWDQFDTSGCIGCGKCITWCPTAINLVEEVNKLREAPGENSDPSAP